jgi:uncharacterized protein (TIGR02996 family)
MTDEQAFIRAICLEPHNLTVRLIFADFLDGNGQHGRAESIRLPFGAHDWEYGHVRKHPVQVTGWSHGFVDHVKTTLAYWYGLSGEGHGPQIVACQPITRVRLTDREPQSCGWRSDVEPSNPAWIPESWYDRTWQLHNQGHLAHDRLSIAAIEWARRIAFGPEWERFTEPTLAAPQGGV